MLKVVSKGYLHGRINYSFVGFAEIKVMVSSYSCIVVNLVFGERIKSLVK